MTNATNTDGTPKYPLANDAQGNPLDVPAEAVAWRLRKLARKAGRPKVLFDAETGRPMELPLETRFEDFADSVNESGRYRLEPVDANGRIIPGCVAITEVVADPGQEEPSPPRDTVEALPELVRLVAQLVKSNAQVMKAMASAFGQVQPPAPQPVVIEHNRGEKSQGESQLGQIIAMLVQKFAGDMTSAPPASPPPSGVAS
jgi:hypothetical protein